VDRHDRVKNSRARVTPADLESVRKFLRRFDREDLEVALEATTGWRSVVEELHRVGTAVHLAEPAETSDLRASERRANSDWTDARHPRELLLIGRLPESWIPPAHILDLLARVRCRLVYAFASSHGAAAPDPGSTGCPPEPPRSTASWFGITGAVVFYGQETAAMTNEPLDRRVEKQYPNNVLALFPWSHLKACGLTSRAAGTSVPRLKFVT
jgi:hypothetical protein